MAVSTSFTGAINDIAEFEADIYNTKSNTYGYVTVRGLRSKQTNEWEIESI